MAVDGGRAKPRHGKASTGRIMAKNRRTHAEITGACAEIAVAVKNGGMRATTIGFRYTA